MFCFYKVIPQQADLLWNHDEKLRGRKHHRDISHDFKIRDENAGQLIGISDLPLFGSLYSH